MDPEVSLQITVAVESLTFAALAFVAGVVGPTEVRRTFVLAPAKIGALATVAIVCAAAAAAASWVELFVVEPGVGSPSEGVIAAGLGIAILLQPVMALLIASGLRRPR